MKSRTLKLQEIVLHLVNPFHHFNRCSCLKRNISTTEPFLVELNYLCLIQWDTLAPDDSNSLECTLSHFRKTFPYSHTNTIVHPHIHPDMHTHPLTHTHTYTHRHIHAPTHTHARNLHTYKVQHQSFLQVRNHLKNYLWSKSNHSRNGDLKPWKEFKLWRREKLLEHS